MIATLHMTKVTIEYGMDRSSETILDLRLLITIISWAILRKYAFTLATYVHFIWLMVDTVYIIFCATTHGPIHMLADRSVTYLIICMIANYNTFISTLLIQPILLILPHYFVVRR